MAQIPNLPRFVSVNYATFKAGTPVADTLYFISDLGVIYQGTNLVTKGVQIAANEPTDKVPGLLYAIGTGTATELVTYDGEGNKSVVAISADAIDAKVKVASDAAAAVAKDLADNYSTTTEVEGLISAAKDEINGTIGDLTAADIAYTPVTDGEVTGATVQDALEAIDSKLAAIAGGEGGDSIASLALRLNTAEGEIDQLQTDVAKAQGDATQAIADAKQANDAIAGFGDIVSKNAADFDAAGSAAAVDTKYAELIGGSFSKDATVATAIDSKVAKEDGKELAATADIAKWNATSATVAAFPVFGDIVTHNAAEFEEAGAAAAAEGRINATLANYSTTEQVEGKISAALSSVLKFKGVVATEAALPTEGMVEGDVYYVTEKSKEFVYVDEDGKKGWEELGGTVDYDGLFESYLAPVKADIKANTDNIQAIIDRMAWQTTMPTE